MRQHTGGNAVAFGRAREIGGDLALGMRVVVPSEGIFQPLLQRRIEFLEREPHRHEFGFAAVRRHDTRRQDRCKRRHGLERRVGVPELVRLVAQRIAVVRRHHFAVRAEIRQGDEIAAHAGRADRHDLRLAEAAGEGKLAFVGHILLAQHDDRVLPRTRRAPAE